MFRNVYYDTKKSLIHLWDSYGYSEIPWVPYVFVKDPNGDFTNLNGEKVSKYEFSSYNDYYSYQKDNKNIYENAVRPETQFLVEHYYKIHDDEIQPPKLKVYYLDIEIDYGKSFPHPSIASDPVSLISIRNNLTDTTITFGTKEYTGDYDIQYIKCDTDRDLLRKFFEYVNLNPPDVISGWNVDKFDLTYLINRDKNINDGKYYGLMSPIGIVKTWKAKDGTMNIDIAGVTIIDYLWTYRWYSPNNLESYKLDFVANYELDKGKLDYSNSGTDLRELYINDFNTYVEYNVIDCKRVHELGQKLGYIKLIQSLSLLTRSPMKYYDKATQLIEGLMLTHIRRNNMCAPYLKGGSQETFEAAYVKEPIKGKHSWLFSIDITSSYPSHMITLNMSIETFYGRILGLTEEKIIQCLINKSFPNFFLFKPGANPIEFKGKKLESFNLAINKRLFSVAPCGTVFINNRPGIISTVERNIFFKRKEVKARMRKASGDERDRLHAYQWSLKILLNAVFGATSVPYSRWFLKDMAEAITSCGRYTIKSGERFTNELMNNPDQGLLDLIQQIKDDYAPF